MIEVNELSLVGRIALGGTLFLFVGGFRFWHCLRRGLDLRRSIESSSKMYRGGIGEVLLDPIACGATLIFTGCFFAERFWKTQAATVADLFRQQFGPTAEQLSCAIQVPSFFLWIGAQFLAMGQLLELSLVLVLVSLFVPMAIALYVPSKQARPGVGNSAMIAGFVAWLVGFTFESRIGIPASLIGLSASAIAAWLAMRSALTR